MGTNIDVSRIMEAFEEVIPDATVSINPDSVKLSENGMDSLDLEEGIRMACLLIGKSVSNNTSGEIYVGIKIDVATESLTMWCVELVGLIKSKLSLYRYVPPGVSIKVEMHPNVVTLRRTAGPGEKRTVTIRVIFVIHEIHADKLNQLISAITDNVSLIKRIVSETIPEAKIHPILPHCIKWCPKISQSGRNDRPLESQPQTEPGSNASETSDDTFVDTESPNPQQHTAQNSTKVQQQKLPYDSRSWWQKANKWVKGLIAGVGVGVGGYFFWKQYQEPVADESLYSQAQKLPTSVKLAGAAGVVGLGAGTGYHLYDTTESPTVSRSAKKKPMRRIDTRLNLSDTTVAAPYSPVTWSLIITGSLVFLSVIGLLLYKRSANDASAVRDEASPNDDPGRYL